jgi:hypothetical protein
MRRGIRNAIIYKYNNPIINIRGHQMAFDSSESRLKKIKKNKKVQESFSLNDITCIDDFGDRIVDFDDDSSILKKIRIIRQILERKR